MTEHLFARLSDVVGGGLFNVVEDATPELGGNLDLNGFTVGVATAADFIKLNALIATSTELNFVAGVTSAIQTQLDGKQPLDADLTTIAGLTATSDNFMQAKAGAWASRTIAQVKTDLSLIGVNSGDQTSIVGITGTKAQFDTAVTDGDFLYVGDITPYTDEMAQDAIGAMLGVSLVYTDLTPLLVRAALTGDVTAAENSNATAIANSVVTLAKMADMATASLIYRKAAGSGVPEVNSLATLKTDLLLTGTNSGDQTSIVGITGTIAQFNTALSDGDFATGGGTATGTNTGDQTSIVGITGSLAEFNAALTGADFATGGGTATGTNTGDQTSIVGITGTVAQFNTAITDGDMATGGGTATGTNTGDQNLFSTIAVAGQSDVVADAVSDILTLIAGANITLTTNAGADTITIAAAAGGSGNFGTGVIDFGAFPGSNVAFADLAATGVISTSKVEAWIRPEATADHTDTDHIAAPMRVVGQYLSNDVIRVYGINENDVVPPLEPNPPNGRKLLSSTTRRTEYLTRQPSPMFVGQFNVNWSWA